MIQTERLFKCVCIGAYYFKMYKVHDNLSWYAPSILGYSSFKVLLI